MLFLIYINDLPTILRYCKHVIFADDTQIYLHCEPKDIENAINLLNEDVEAVAAWADLNGLKLNEMKTKVMIIGNRVNTSQAFLDALPRVNLRGTSLEYTSKIVNLGLRLTSTLHWGDQVRYISIRVYTTLRSLRFFRRSFTRDLRKKLVESLIFPYFDFASAVFQDLNVTLSESLEILLKACVRYVVGNIPFRAHVTPHRISLGWLSAKRRREYFTAMQAYKSLATLNPSYIESRFSRVGNHTMLRRSERHPAQTLFCNFSRPEKANCSFKKARDLYACIAVKYSRLRLSDARF